MKRLLEILTPQEAAEFGRSFDPSTAVRPESVDLQKSVQAYVEKRLYVDTAALERWTGQDGLRRSRMISEIIWRVTCRLDGSETAVPGLTRFNLGYGFSLAITEMGGHEAMIIQ